jgi:hypothetical protein
MPAPDDQQKHAPSRARLPLFDGAAPRLLGSGAQGSKLATAPCLKSRACAVVRSQDCGVLTTSILRTPRPPGGAQRARRHRESAVRRFRQDRACLSIRFSRTTTAGSSARRSPPAPAPATGAGWASSSSISPPATSSRPSSRPTESMTAARCSATGAGGSSIAASRPRRSTSRSPQRRRCWTHEHCRRSACRASSSTRPRRGRSHRSSCAPCSAKPIACARAATGRSWNCCCAPACGSANSPIWTPATCA